MKKLWRPPDGWKNPYKLNLDKPWPCLLKELYEIWFMKPEHSAAFELGADAMLKALEPLIRRIAPSSKLIDILYSKEERWRG